MRPGNKISTLHLQGKKQILLSEGYLPTDKITKIDKYLRFYGFLSQSAEDYMQGDFRGKIKKSTGRIYGLLLTSFMWFVFSRNLLLAFIDDPTIRSYLGESQNVRPSKQLTMAMTLWSIYTALVMKLYWNAEKYRFYNWLAPFLVYKGFISPQKMGLDMEMTDRWFSKTNKELPMFMMIVNIRWILGSTIFAWVAYVRWSANSVQETFNIAWAVILTVWVYYSSAIIYITYAYYDSLCFYFRMRFNKVNNDIEYIINPENRMKPNERSTMLHQILVEHNELCIKVTNYNQFWSKYLMYTYFMLVAIICYSTFQAFFTYNTLIVRAAMFLITLEAATMLTKTSVCAALLSSEAHSSYGRLIRVTFDKYPIDLQIQLRMFIQRLSGPTIGFYCLDLFEVTYSTYASIIAALGQNFLLIVDFVRSYAELADKVPATEIELPDVFFGNGSFPISLAYTADNETLYPKADMFGFEEFGSPFLT